MYENTQIQSDVYARSLSRRAPQYLFCLRFRGSDLINNEGCASPSFFFATPKSNVLSFFPFARVSNPSILHSSRAPRACPEKIALIFANGFNFNNFHRITEILCWWHLPPVYANKCCSTATCKSGNKREREQAGRERKMLIESPFDVSGQLTSISLRRQKADAAIRTIGDYKHAVIRDIPWSMRVLS